MTVRVGVVGVGALGQHHARVYADLPGASLAGIYDVDHARAAEVAARHGVPAFSHMRELAGAVDAISIAVPTVDHHRVARELLEAGQDVLVGEPVTARPEEAGGLVGLARAEGAVLQGGHIGRVHPAVGALRKAAPR